MKKKTAKQKLKEWTDFQDSRALTVVIPDEVLIKDDFFVDYDLLIRFYYGGQVFIGWRNSGKCSIEEFDVKTKVGWDNALAE